MKQDILDQCNTRGTCPLDKKQFDESFAGRDLTIQVRAALDFASQNGLAFGRSSGGQQFLFTRSAHAPEATPQQHQQQRRRDRRKSSAR